MNENRIGGDSLYETPALDCIGIAVEEGFAQTGETGIDNLPFGDAPDYSDGVTL